MEVVTINKNLDGQVIIVDGRIVFVESVQYSADLTHWESVFVDTEHWSTEYNMMLQGAVYRRYRHAGDTNFQMPHKFVAKDGKGIELRFYEERYIQWAEQGSNDWKPLVDMTNFTGAKGDTGEIGKGLDIQYAGFFDERPACGGTISPIKQGCGCGSTNVLPQLETPSLFLCLGDTRYYTLTSFDVSQQNLYCSTNGIDWISQNNPLLVGTKVSYYNATTPDTFNAKSRDFKNDENYGKVFGCAGGIWVEVSGIAVPTGLVKLNAFSPLGYLVDFFTKEFFIVDNTGKFTIKANSFTLDEIDNGIFGKGLKTIVVNGIEQLIVDITSLVAQGSPIYINEEGLLDFNSSSLAGRGLQVSNDNKLLNIKLEDFIDVSNGLELYTAGGSKFLRLKFGKGIMGSTSGISAVLDETTITFDGNTRIAIKDGGVYAVKLNADVAGKGIVLEPLTNKITVNIDGTYFEFTQAGVVTLKDNAIESNKLKAGMFSRGLRLVNVENKPLLPKLVELYLKDGLKFDAPDNSGNVSISVDFSKVLSKDSPEYVRSVVGKDSPVDQKLTGDLVVRGSVNTELDTLLNPFEVNVTSDATKEELVISLTVNKQKLLSLVSNGGVVWESLRKSPDDARTIEQYFENLITNLRGYARKDINNHILLSAGGTLDPLEQDLVGVSSGGKKFKLIVDDSGNWGSIPVNN